MGEVAVEAMELRAVAQNRQQVGPHGHQRGGAAGGAVEPSEQLLAARLGGVVDLLGAVGRGRVAPGFEGRSKPGRVGSEPVQESAEEFEPVGRRQGGVAGERLARHGGAGRLAAARQQRAGKGEQRPDRVAAVAAPFATRQEGPAAFGDRRQEIGEKGIGHDTSTPAGSNLDQLCLSPRMARASAAVAGLVP